MIRVMRYIAVVLILYLVLISSCSNTTDYEVQTKSFIWEVSSDTNTVYLLGSVHIAKADIYPLERVIEDAYELSEYLVVEIDESSVTEEEMNALLLEKGMYPPAENLRVNISDELYSRLSNRLMEFDSSGILLLSMNNLKPWVVAIVITELDYMELGYEIEYGIETYFLRRARTDGKKVLELESAEFQLDLFDSLPEESQIMLLENATDNPVTREESEMMFYAWLTGDTEKMEQIVFEDIEGSPEYQILNEKIIDERNFQMVEKIDSYLQSDSIYFVIIGAGHLIGENGIIDLLINKGYSVEQLSR